MNFTLQLYREGILVVNLWNILGEKLLQWI